MDLERPPWTVIVMALTVVMTAIGEAEFWAFTLALILAVGAILWLTGLVRQERALARFRRTHDPGHVVVIDRAGRPRCITCEP
ncbi:MAG: hypothetical protein ACOYY2_03000 [Actinomycetota bacterium]